MSGNAYDYIDPTVTSMMAGCVPVDLNPDNTLAIPRSYEPQEGPPVLMLRPGEQVNVRWSEGMEKAAQHVLKLSNTVLSMADLEALIIPVPKSFSYIHGFALNLTNHSHPGITPEPLVVPLYVGLRPLTLEADRNISLLHECDHWDFRLNTAPLFSLPGENPLPPGGSSTLMEKRGYMTNYTHFTNRGLTGYFMTAEQLAYSMQGYDPTEAAKIAWNKYYELLPPQSHTATIAMALSLCFGDGNKLSSVNQQEIDAYKAAGLIHH